MKVITLANSKGGVGKSTIASNLIYLAIEMNYDVGFIDLDKQKSLDEWVKKQKVEIKNIKINDLNKFTKKKLKFDFLFIDTQASIRKTRLEEILRITDIVIIPSSGTYLDLNATRKFLKRINSYREKNIKVLGKQALGMFLVGTDSMQAGKFISEHDQKIANKLAYIMAGGDLSESTLVVNILLEPVTLRCHCSFCLAAGFSML